MKGSNLNLVPIILAAIGLIADVIGIYTFLNLDSSPESTARQQFFPIAELLLFYSGAVFVWYNFNRIGGTFSDFGEYDDRALIPPGLFLVLTFPLQIYLCDSFGKALLLHICLIIFIALGGHLLYKWQHLKE